MMSTIIDLYNYICRLEKTDDASRGKDGDMRAGTCCIMSRSKGRAQAGNWRLLQQQNALNGKARSLPGLESRPQLLFAQWQLVVRLLTVNTCLRPSQPSRQTQPMNDERVSRSPCFL